MHYPENRRNYGNSRYTAGTTSIGSGMRLSITGGGLVIRLFGSLHSYCFSELALPRHRRQKPDETIQAFSDELFTLSRKAYPNLRGHEAFIETELVEIFTERLPPAD
jgi:hypothetical protein